MILVWVLVGGVFLGLVVIQFGAFGGLSHFFDQPILDESVAATVFLAGVISGFATYFLLKRKHEAKLKELSSLIAEMKKVEEDQKRAANDGNGEVVTENALYLADKILTLLPEMVRKRGQDSLLFGVVAFIVAEVIGRNLAVAILVGAIVWLYFRYEFRRSYEREASKFEEQKRAFEQRKKDFMETMETP